MQLARYQYTAKHVPGKFLVIANTLLRAPVPQSSEDECASELQHEVKAFVDSVTLNLPAKEPHLKEYQQTQLNNPICSQVRNHCESSWPTKRLVNEDLIPYWRVKASVDLQNFTTLQ